MKKNQSENIRVVILGLATFGFLIATILSYAQLSNHEFCGSCKFDIYANAFWFNWPSKLYLPNSILGMFYYGMIIILNWSNSVWIQPLIKPRVLLVFSAFGFSYSFYLQALSIGFLGQICPLCFTSACICLAIFILAIKRLF